MKKLIFALMGSIVFALPLYPAEAKKLTYETQAAPDDYIPLHGSNAQAVLRNRTSDTIFTIKYTVNNEQKTVMLQPDKTYTIPYPLEMMEMDFSIDDEPFKFSDYLKEGKIRENSNLELYIGANEEGYPKIIRAPHQRTSASMVPPMPLKPLWITIPKPQKPILKPSILKPSQKQKPSSQDILRRLQAIREKKPETKPLLVEIPIKPEEEQ